MKIAIFQQLHIAGIYCKFCLQPISFYCLLFSSSGSNGSGLNISHFKLSPEDRRKEKDGQKQHRFNAYLSDVISFHRQLTDMRHEELVYFLAIPFKKSMKMDTILKGHLWRSLLSKILTAFVVSK